jgi:hypothetical protein
LREANRRLIIINPEQPTTTTTTDAPHSATRAKDNGDARDRDESNKQRKKGKGARDDASSSGDRIDGSEEDSEAPSTDLEKNRDIDDGDDDDEAAGAEEARRRKQKKREKNGGHDALDAPREARTTRIGRAPGSEQRERRQPREQKS